MKKEVNIPSPCFVLEEQKLVKNLETIQRVQKDAGVEIILAFKGFAMWSLFPLMRKYIGGATASSLNEALLCNDKMGAKSHTYCVAYDPDEFTQIVKLSSHLTFNSLSQYKRFINDVPTDVEVGLRINPEVSDVETKLYNPANPNSRLGINAVDLTSLPERVSGLHFHVLCESDSYALANVLDSLESKFGHLLAGIKWVNMGGGHLMTKKGYDIDHLIALLKQFKTKHGVDIILEPGSAFAWQTGDLHTRVLDVVANGGVKTAIIDASFTCHMPDCLEMPYRPVITGANEKYDANSFPYRIGGVSCLAGDYLDEYWFDNPLKPGDKIIFEDMMHYTMVKTSFFNGVKHPSIGILKANGEFELIREFGYSAFRDRLS